MPSRPATAAHVIVNGQLSPELIPLTAVQASGGGLRDEATFLVNLGASSSYIQNFVAVPGGAICQIYAYPNGVATLVHWGKVDVTSIGIGDSETLSFSSRVESFHFGLVMDGINVWEPVSGQVLTLQEACVFNPQIDDLAFPNQSSLYRLAGLAPVMLDPESCRTQAAQTIQGDTPKFWTVQTAVAYLCWSLNPSQTNILNPLQATINLLPTFPLKNFHLERGQFLCDCLDDLLPRFGLGWYLDLSNGFKPQIAFFVRGLGVANTVYLGPPGSFYNGDNALDTNVHYDVGNTRNQAVVVGDHRYLEATFELQKGWKKSFDDTAEDKLSKDSDSFIDPANSFRDVWRKWVLNEAGDYVGTRPEIKAAYDLASIIGHAIVPRRRRFLPMITLDNDGAPFGRVDGVVVEYSVDQGSTWNDVCNLEDCKVELLDRECGIRFDGFFPPAEMRRAADNGNTPEKVKVRVTATIRDDKRLQTTIGPNVTSPLADTAPFYVDASASFHWREISTKSSFYSAVASGELKADTVKDDSPLNDYATWLQQVFDIGDVSGSMVVEGLDTVGSGGTYQIGQTISGITGRNISFNAQSPFSGEMVFPQIVAIATDFQRQTRRLTLETVRDASESEAINADRFERKMLRSAARANRRRR